MNAGATTEQDAAYRRGTVLGLTIAEVFILLLFLILIVLFALVRDRMERAERAEDRLRTWQPVIEEFKAPEEIETLRQQKETAEATAESQRRRADVLREALDDSGDVGAAIDEALAEAEWARGEALEAKRELSLLRKKGLNPPCWYEVVSTATGGSRERPYYTFNIAVFDDSMIVLPAQTPPGGAIDDSDATYAQEAQTLELALLPYGERLGDSAFDASFKRIAQAGKSKGVRSYSCIFWVRVWDRTSPEAKRRWQRAHDQIIEGLFGAYHVKDDPWPGKLAGEAA